MLELLTPIRLDLDPDPPSASLAANPDADAAPAADALELDDPALSRLPRGEDSSTALWAAVIISWASYCRHMAPATPREEEEEAGMSRDRVGGVQTFLDRALLAVGVATAMLPDEPRGADDDAATAATTSA